MVQRIQALEAQIQEMELNGVKGQINEESGQAGQDAQEEGTLESEIEKIQNSIPEDMKGEINLEEIKARLGDQLTETVKKGMSDLVRRQKHLRVAQLQFQKIIENEENYYQRPEFDNVHLSSLQKILIAFNFTQFSEKLY